MELHDIGKEIKEEMNLVCFFCCYLPPFFQIVEPFCVEEDGVYACSKRFSELDFF